MKCWWVRCWERWRVSRYRCVTLIIIRVTHTGVAPYSTTIPLPSVGGARGWAWETVVAAPPHCVVTEVAAGRRRRDLKHPHRHVLSWGLPRGPSAEGGVGPYAMLLRGPTPLPRLGDLPRLGGRGAGSTGTMTGGTGKV
eukprot:COSAG01_NODE_35_length_34814_cov_128.883624_27_plen_139_part_00